LPGAYELGFAFSFGASESADDIEVAGEGYALTVVLCFVQDDGEFEIEDLSQIAEQRNTPFLLGGISIAQNVLLYTEEGSLVRTAVAQAMPMRVELEDD